MFQMTHQALLLLNWVAGFAGLVGFDTLYFGRQGRANDVGNFWRQISRLHGADRSGLPVDTLKRTRLICGTARSTWSQKPQFSCHFRNIWQKNDCRDCRLLGLFIAVVASVIQPPVDVEFKEGVIHVPYESHQIAQAIESLLIDRIRLGALKIRSAAVVTSMPRPIEATQALLREFRAACREEVKLHQSRDDQSIDRLLSDVA